MRQFELYWAQLPEPVGRRPVLLLSRTPAYAYLSRFMVAEVTTHPRLIPQEIALGRREGLAQPSVANLDHVHMVDRNRVGERIGAVGRAREIEVKRALGHALGWPELKELE